MLELRSQLVTLFRIGMCCVPGVCAVPLMLLHVCQQAINRPRGVTVSTLDSESSDRGSNPREAF